MKEVTRRDVLAGVASMGAIGMSGCAAQSEDLFGDSPDETDDEDSPSDTSEGTPDPGGTDDGTAASRDDRTDGTPGNVADAPGIDDASIETVRSDCGSLDDNGITVEGDGSTVIVEGVLPAPNPCHEAVLTAGSVDDGTLSLVVDVADTTEDDEGCMMCQGVVSYRATVELGDPSAVESVAVDHETGNRHTADVDGGDTDTDAPVESASIETVDASCASGDGEKVTVDFGDDAITVTGTLPAPNPCHESVLGPIDLDDGQLSVVVDVSSTQEMCVECVGAISYEAVIEPTDPSAVTEVAVDHRTGAESRVVR